MVTKIEKNVCKRNKKRYLFLVLFNSKKWPSRHLGMPFSLVLQKLSSF